jgi:putative ABC transport system substrate-binding protein
MALNVLRRKFIAALGGAVVAWPLAHAQQQERMRRVEVLIGTSENDPESKLRVEALRQGLLEAGWKEGSNIHLEYRFGGADPERMRRL